MNLLSMNVMILLMSLVLSHNRSHQGRGSRMAYFRGLLQGFRDKLREQQREIEVEGALVWIGDPRLRTFYRWQNPRVATRRVGGDTGSPASGGPPGPAPKPSSSSLSLCPWPWSWSQ